MNTYIRLKKKIQNKKKLSVGIIGLGYVGLPLSLTICEQGYKVLVLIKIVLRLIY